MNNIVRKKLDSGWIGFAFGLSAPIVALYFFYLIKYSHISFVSFYFDILLVNDIVTSAISLCVISNLLVFFIFIWTNRNYSARGVLFSTIIYAGFVVYQKYIR
jgi:hypothetical protein